VSIYRIKTLHSAASTTDPTWDNVDAATFSFLELSVGVIAVCLPTLRPILVHAMPRIFGSLLRSAGHDYSGGTEGYGPNTGGGRYASRSRGPPTIGGTGAVGSSSGFNKGSTLRESESTEGLRASDEEAVLPPRSRTGDNSDIEFGVLDNRSGSVGKAGGKRYSVSVVAGGGWDDPEAGRDGNSKNVMNGIQKTTTVVMQKVTLAGRLEEEDDDDRGKRHGAKRTM
jgi:hypothetical protein